jgi:hypothetical protein
MHLEGGAAVPDLVSSDGSGNRGRGIIANIVLGIAKTWIRR